LRKQEPSGGGTQREKLSGVYTHLKMYGKAKNELFRKKINHTLLGTPLRDLFGGIRAGKGFFKKLKNKRPRTKVLHPKKEIPRACAVGLGAEES